MALLTIPAVARTPHTGPGNHGRSAENPGANVSMAYCEKYPNEAITPQRSKIVVVPARYMELRAVSIVEWIVCQLSSGESGLSSLLDPCISRLLAVIWL
jgi:hypothetical protein